MKRLKIILSIIVVLVTTMVSRAADKVEFNASAPEVVYEGTPFQLRYTINQKNSKNLKTPDFGYFDIVGGPFQSQSSYTQIINGKASSNFTLTYTYTLIANKKGNYSIAPASIMVDDEKVFSNGISIKVESADVAPNSRDNSQSQSSTQTIDNESVFIKTIVSNRNIYEQEAIVVTYKLYTRLDIGQFTNVKLPDFNGFLKQDIDQPNNKQLSSETYNNKSYGTVVLHQVVLFPQRTGVIKIDPARFTAILKVQNNSRRTRSIFDDFFDSYTQVEKVLVAPAISVDVKELPNTNRPTAFSGGVGDFTLKSDISSLNLKANEAATIRLVISGNGNMKLLNTPKIKFPEGFDLFDPEINNSFKTTTNGLSGSKTIEYVFIPRHSGKFEIPSAELSFFDLKSKRYKTLLTPTYKIEVAKDINSNNSGSVSSNYTNKERVKQLAKDIRFIKTDKIKLIQQEKPLFGTLQYWLILIVIIIVAAILFIYIRKLLKDRANVIFIKTKRANKVAQKRLKTAHKYLLEGNKKEFYSEVIKAVWAYISDKLSIPVSELNKDDISEKMEIKNIDKALIMKFLKVLNECEFATYAPPTDSHAMDNLYNDTLSAISELENEIKKVKP